MVGFGDTGRNALCDSYEAGFVCADNAGVSGGMQMNAFAGLKRGGAMSMKHGLVAPPCPMQ